MTVDNSIVAASAVIVAVVIGWFLGQYTFVKPRLVVNFELSPLCAKYDLVRLKVSNEGVVIV